MAKDWRLMRAGTLLDRVIAERLGYKAEVILDAFDVGRMMNEGNWYIVSPDRPNLGINVFGQATAGGAWREAFRADAECGGYNGWTLRMWSRSVDAALTLLPDDENWWSLHHDGSGTTCAITRFQEGIPRSIYGRADTPALAICRAWLDWQEKRTE